MLLTERGGVSRYHGVFFVRRDSGLERLADLKGRTVAFQNTASTSAYFAPSVALLDAGQRMEILLSPMDRPSADSVGYVFARSELNIAAWVHKRLVDAGVVSNLDWDDVRRMPPGFRRDFRVIHETQDFPRALEMVRGDLDPAVEARLREVLLEAANDPAARDALNVFFRTTRFLPVDPASQQALDNLRRGVARVREQVE
jgi:phosphonate transport system substrate-binding protein